MNAPMCLIHMIIALGRCIKMLHAYPADVCPAPSTSHMVTAISLLHSSLALGAVLDAQLLFDPLERLIPARRNVLMVRAGHTRVRSMAGGTCWDKAVGTGKRLAPGRGRRCPIDLPAVGCGTISKAVGVVADIGGK